MLSSYQKLECFCNLCKIAITDNNYLTSQEEDILLEAARKMGIHKLHAWGILKRAYVHTLIVPEGSEIQKTYLECTIGALIVECDLPDQAYEWCLAIAKLLTLNEVILLKMTERLSREACLGLLF